MVIRDSTSWIRAVTVVGLIGGPLAGTSASAQENRRVQDGRIVTGTLSFDGHATAGDFIGQTTTVSGQLNGAPDLTGVKGWVEAPVQTLKTGNGRRDKDLNKSLESEKYPVLRFDLTQVTRRRGGGQGGGSTDSVSVLLHGGLTIHGVTRSVELPATIRFSASSAQVRTDFPLNLKDYRIGGLSKLLGMLKMYEKIEVHADLMFRLAESG